MNVRGLWVVLVAGLMLPAAHADVSLNNMFGDHMVLQQGIKNKVWGQADPGEQVTVTLAKQSHATTAGADGMWHVFLDPVQEYGGPHALTVKGKNTVTFNDVLIGEVWVCSGQSNMQWSVNQANDPDLEKATAKYPTIRLISVPQVGTQEPQWNFNGKWQVCSPETVGDFSAVGYFFGRQLQQTLGVPIGLIDNAWGGSAADAWVKREKIAAHTTLKAIHERWLKMEEALPTAMANFEKTLEAHKAAAAQAKAAGQPVPRPPQSPDAQMRGNARPGNIHSGVLTPSLGYGIKGAIWYQGESNAGRAYQYRELFPFMIKSWREEWDLGDFPFYWVQLADFKAEKTEPAESDWAELREAQTMTMKALPNTGEAVIIDLGEAKTSIPKTSRAWPCGSPAGRSRKPTRCQASPAAARSTPRWRSRAPRSCSRSTTSSRRRAAGGRLMWPSRLASRLPERTKSLWLRRPASCPMAGSRSGARPWPIRWQFVTPGQTIRIATCTPPRGYRSRLSARMTSRA